MTAKRADVILLVDDLPLAVSPRRCLADLDRADFIEPLLVTHAPRRLSCFHTHPDQLRLNLIMSGPDQ